MSIIKNEIRYVLVNLVFGDWKRIMDNGLTAKEAREVVERDYELMEAELFVLHAMMLNELEERTKKE